MTSSRRRGSRRLHRAAATALASLFAAGCAGKAIHGGTTAHAPLSAEEISRRYEKMMARENGPFTKHELELLDGLASGAVEAKVKPKPECERDKDDDVSCTFSIELGNDEEGDADNIICNVSTSLRPFGPGLKKVLGESQLGEPPQLAAKAVGEGITVEFVANTTVEEQTITRIGTAKVSALYAHGYVTTCWDGMAGGRKTFERVVGQFFQSLKFKTNPKLPTLFAVGYQRREGDRTTGIRYDYIEKRRDGESGFNEMSTHFSLETNGKQWTVYDHGMYVARDEAGEVDTLRTLHWIDGNGPLVLAAKPSEDKRFRLKMEVGEKTSSLESTPKAPLNTELWAANELLKVSSGAAPSYRYAILAMDDSDPVFQYITLSRSQPGVLLEDEETTPSGGKKGANTSPPDAKAKDELHVDGRGLVTKEISSDSVSELISTWGELPLVISNKKDKDKALPRTIAPASAATKKPR